MLDEVQVNYAQPCLGLKNPEILNTLARSKRNNLGTPVAVHLRLKEWRTGAAGFLGVAYFRTETCRKKGGPVVKKQG